MTDIAQDRRATFRAAIEKFLQIRRAAALDELSTNDPKRESLASGYRAETWVPDAAKKARQVQLVTHLLKATYPEADIKSTTSLYVVPSAKQTWLEVASHAIAGSYRDDVTGNAAVGAAIRSDIRGFINIPCFGQTLLDWMRAADADLCAVLEELGCDAADVCRSFIQFRDGPVTPASHTRAKQLYWLVGEDPCQNDDFHLLAPLYASSLAHAVFATINEDRFGDEAKAARKARRERRDHAHGYADYPGLAAQKLGGTKPQNISQLNSERGGNNYLLGSLPPTWKTRDVREPWRQDSVFPRFGYRPLVRERVDALRHFLNNDPDRARDTRNRRDELTDTIIDELVCFARELHEGLNPGWSADPKCELVEAERLWLDPGRAETDLDFRQRWLSTDWPADIGHRFGNWLNARLKGQLPVGDIEQRHWSKELLIDDAWADWLYRQRHKVSTMEPEMAGGEA
ncbi:MAG: type I-F CRISPR-associated protein Csy1 [Pseudolabrys sp.]